MATVTLKSATCPNGKFGEHNISVEQRDTENGCEYVWRNGYSDPLICTYDQAIGLFNNRLKQAAFDLLNEAITAKDAPSLSYRLGKARIFLATVSE